MVQKSDTHVFTGLQQDISISKQSPEHLIDAHNIRITAKQGETLFSLTNERGPLLLQLVDEDGNDYEIEEDSTIIGYCNLNEYLVLFVTGAGDSILRVDMSKEKPVVKELFWGSLNFDVNYPIEAVVDYENEDIQKVYWTDNRNQPRMINIMKEDYDWEGAFDFNPELQLKETVEVTKESSSSGSFSPGVIQYALTYYNKHAQETAIFYTTPLQYISYFDRGAKAEDVVSNAFKIKVDNIDKHFDYLRIYSIHRKTLNGTPICKRVQDIQTSKNTIKYNFELQGAERYSEKYSFSNHEFSIWSSISEVISIESVARNFSKKLLNDNLTIDDKSYFSYNYSDVINYFIAKENGELYTLYKPSSLENLYLLNDKAMLFPTFSNKFAVGDTIKLFAEGYFRTALQETAYIQTKSGDTWVNVQEFPYNQEVSYTLRSTEDRIYCEKTNTIIDHNSTLTLDGIPEGTNLITDGSKVIEEQTPRYGYLDYGSSIDYNVEYRFGNVGGTCKAALDESLTYAKYEFTFYGSTIDESEYYAMLEIRKADGSAFREGEQITVKVNSSVISDYNTEQKGASYLGGNLWFGLYTNDYNHKMLARISSGHTYDSPILTYTVKSTDNFSAVILQCNGGGLFVIKNGQANTKYTEKYSATLTGYVVDYYQGSGSIEYLKIPLNDLSYETSKEYTSGRHYYRVYKYPDTDVYNIMSFDYSYDKATLDDLLTSKKQIEKNDTYKLYSTTYEGESYIFHKNKVYKGDYKIVAEESTSENTSITFVDTGNEGDTIDSTELLFKGGEQLLAQNICSKDGTLFLGNIKLNRKSIRSIESIKALSQNLSPSTYHNYVEGTLVSNSYSYPYINCLNTNAAGFKNREYYRLGYQAQYKDGKWSDPIWIKDYQVKSDDFSSTYVSNTYSLVDKLFIKCSLPTSITTALVNAGYKRVRPLVVFPDIQDRTVLCQGIINPTMSTDKNVEAGLNAQSSWFFRPLMPNISSLEEYYNSSYYSTTTCSPYSGITGSKIPYIGASNNYNPKGIRAVEIQGDYDADAQFWINWNVLTFHSPELEFDESYKALDYSNIKARVVGFAAFNNVMSDIDIVTSTPTISEFGSGFIKKTFNVSYNGIISGLFYDDKVVDDFDPKETKEFMPYDETPYAQKFIVYAWNKNNSLNNDASRVADAGGQRTAMLSKKIISNLRTSVSMFYKNSDLGNNFLANTTGYRPQIFDSQEVSALKLSTVTYEGNIDTLLAPDTSEGQYFCYGSDGKPETLSGAQVPTPFNSTNYFKTWAPDAGSTDDASIYYWTGTQWKKNTDFKVGDKYVRLARKKEPVRMKYKTTPHLVMYTKESFAASTATSAPNLPLVELYRDYDYTTMFGGQSDDAFKANTWLPAGKPIDLSSTSAANLLYEYGDTWFSRYDCLKTYAYTNDDTNQIVEIGSMMVETRVNIDGRTDRNRGQINNLYMTPKNFNLYNDVYSQKDNYFSYKILDEDYYTIDKYPTQLTWSLQKYAGSETDIWTSFTMASTFDVDGTYGEIQALVNWNNNIYCFQDTNICNILFNSRVQIPTSEGAPIEITNNYKVDGKRDFVNNIGCINKYSICKTPLYLYFIDSVSNHLMSISSGGVNDLSQSMNMTTWYNGILNQKWLPDSYSTKVFYDGKDKDLYTITKDTALGYNEVFKQYTSFYSYDDTPYMFNLQDDFFCVRKNKVYKMFAGTYNDFFGTEKPYDITFISNGRSGNADLSSIDKVFSTIDFRANKFDADTNKEISDEFPFSDIRIWNEFQDTGIQTLYDVKDFPAILKKKFRTWRVTIPRDTIHSSGRDRIRNNWCKIYLYNVGDGFNTKMELHDIVVQYFV